MRPVQTIFGYHFGYHFGYQVNAMKRNQVPLRGTLSAVLFAPRFGHVVLAGCCEIPAVLLTGKACKAPLGSTASVTVLKQPLDIDAAGWIQVWQKQDAPVAETASVSRRRGSAGTAGMRPVLNASGSVARSGLAGAFASAIAGGMRRPLAADGLLRTARP
jgi:hypothetical protein